MQGSTIAYRVSGKMSVAVIRHKLMQRHTENVST